MSSFQRGDLLAAAQCARRAWLQLHTSGAAPGLPRTDDRDAVRDAARRRFPGGIVVPAEGGDAQRQAATFRAMAEPVPAVFDAVFVAEDVRVRAAILARAPGGWRVVEARSANSVGEVHERELAAVAWGAARAGVPVVGLTLLHLNADYVRGEELDEGALFVEVHVAPRDFSAARAVLERARGAEEVHVPMGAHCTQPRECPFREHCSPPVGPFSVSRLPRTGRLRAELAELGIDDVRRIPSHVRMSPPQQRAVWALVNGREYLGQALGPALRNLSWPLRFLDFEACQPAVPRWPDTGPFEQVPTQWSMHTQAADGQVEHHAFLHRGHGDPRVPFVRSLMAAVGSSGSIVVYSGAEASTLRALQKWVPEAWSDLESLVGRLVDLLPVLRDHYAHPALDGRVALKVLAPAVDAELGYGDLPVQDGATAAHLWLRMVSPRTSAAEQDLIAAQLLAYCERDTWVLLRVHNALVARTGG